MSKECCCNSDDPPEDQLWYPVTICSEVGLPPADCDEYIFANQEVCNWCTSEEKYHFYKPCEESGYLAGCCIKIPDGAIAYIKEINLPDNNCKLESTEDLEQLAIDDCWACCAAENQTDNCQEPDTCGVCVDGLGGACQGGDTIKCGEGSICGDYSVTITTPSAQVYCDYEYVTSNDSGCCVQTYPAFAVTTPLTQRLPVATYPCTWHIGEAGVNEVVADSPSDTVNYIRPQQYVAGYYCTDPDHGCYCRGFPSTWDDCPQCGVGLSCPCCKHIQLDEFVVTFTIYEVSDAYPPSGNACSPTPCSVWYCHLEVSAKNHKCEYPDCMEECGVEDCFPCNWVLEGSVSSDASWKVVKPYCGCPTGDFSPSLRSAPYVGNQTAEFCPALMSIPDEDIADGFSSIEHYPMKYDHKSWLDGITVTIS